MEHVAEIIERALPPAPPTPAAQRYRELALCAVIELEHIIQRRRRQPILDSVLELAAMLEPLRAHVPAVDRLVAAAMFRAVQKPVDRTAALARPAHLPIVQYRLGVAPRAQRFHPERLPAWKFIDRHFAAVELHDTSGPEMARAWKLAHAGGTDLHVIDALVVVEPRGITA